MTDLEQQRDAAAQAVIDMFAAAIDALTVLWAIAPDRAALITREHRDRAEGYEVRSVRAADEGNIAGHDEQAVIEELDYPGCCDAETAQRIAARELAARSKPFVRCRAIVKRTALRVEPGDPVRVVYTSPDVNAIFRVVDVDRGSPKDGAIALDLVLDTSYVWRGQNPQLPDYGGLPLPPTLPIDVGP